MLIVRDPEQAGSTWLYRAMVQRRDRSACGSIRKSTGAFSRKNWRDARRAGGGGIRLRAGDLSDRVDVAALRYFGVRTRRRLSRQPGGRRRAAADQAARAGPRRNRHRRRNSAGERRDRGEGPFASGRVTTPSGTGSGCAIKRIYYRDNPIIAGAPPLRPINWSNFTNYVHLWEHLERSGITDINGVGVFTTVCSPCVSLKQRYAGHAKQALITAAGFRHGDMKTYYVHGG